jgi:hypothetical protein
MGVVRGFGLAALAAGVFLSSLLGGGGAFAASAEKGKAAYIQHGCWQCHGIQAQGGVTGPKLAPDPLRSRHSRLSCAPPTAPCRPTRRRSCRMGISRIFTPICRRSRSRLITRASRCSTSRASKTPLVPAKAGIRTTDWIRRRPEPLQSRASWVIHRAAACCGTYSAATAPNGHDDLANAVAGAAAATRSKYRYDSSLDWVAGPDYGKSGADAA